MDAEVRKTYKLKNNMNALWSSNLLHKTTFLFFHLIEQLRSFENMKKEKRRSFRSLLRLRPLVMCFFFFFFLTITHREEKTSLLTLTEKKTLKFNPKIESERKRFNSTVSRCKARMLGYLGKLLLSTQYSFG